MESTVNAFLKYLESLYTMICICLLHSICIGIEYTKNNKQYSNIKLYTHAKTKSGNRVRIISFFKIGSTVFNNAFNSLKYIYIPIKFILYDM